MEQLTTSLALVVLNAVLMIINYKHRNYKTSIFCGFNTGFSSVGLLKAIFELL